MKIANKTYSLEIVEVPVTVTHSGRDCYNLYIGRILYNKGATIGETEPYKSQSKALRKLKKGSIILEEHRVNKRTATIKYNDITDGYSIVISENATTDVFVYNYYYTRIGAEIACRRILNEWAQSEAKKQIANSKTISSQTIKT